MYYINLNRCLFDKHLYKFLLTCQSEKKYILIEVKLFVFFTFFHNFFLKTLIKSIIYS